MVDAVLLFERDYDFLCKMPSLPDGIAILSTITGVMHSPTINRRGRCVGAEIAGHTIWLDQWGIGLQKLHDTDRSSNWEHIFTDRGRYRETLNKGAYLYRIPAFEHIVHIACECCGHKIHQFNIEQPDTSSCERCKK